MCSAPLPGLAGLLAHRRDPLGRALHDLILAEMDLNGLVVRLSHSLVANEADAQIGRLLDRVDRTRAQLDRARRETLAGAAADAEAA